MESPIQCSVVIPAYNEEAHIRATLLSLIDQSLPRTSYEIIVVDNGSTDSTRSIAEQYANKVLSKPDGNVGAVRNYGIRHAKGDFIVCTDADCIFDTEWLETGVHLLKNNPDSVFGGGLKPSLNGGWVERLWLLNPGGKAVQQKSLMGSCIFVRRKHFDSVDGFLVDITSGEDSDFSARLEQEGVKVSMTNRLSVVHNGGAKTLKDFVARQSWHAENYLKDIRNSLKDKVFVLCILYVISVLGVLLAAVFKPTLATAYIGLFLASPLVLTIKRLLRAKYTPSALDVIGIYILDHAYLTGRAIGILRGLRNHITKKRN